MMQIQVNSSEMNKQVKQNFNGKKKKKSRNNKILTKQEWQKEHVALT